MKTIPLYEFGGPSVDDPTAITITSTSSRSGITEPIDLRNATDFTRLQFHPIVIQNENEPSNCVKGSLVYEKKRKRDPGFPYDKPEELVTKGTVKAGGALRLDLDTSETRKLYDSLTRLYRVAGDMEGMPYGSATYVPIDRSAKTLVDLLKKDPSAMRMIADEGVFELVKELLKLLTQGISLEKLSETLGSLEDGSLQSLSASLNIELFGFTTSSSGIWKTAPSAIGRTSLSAMHGSYLKSFLVRVPYSSHKPMLEANQLGTPAHVSQTSYIAIS